MTTTLATPSLTDTRPAARATAAHVPGRRRLLRAVRGELRKLLTSRSPFVMLGVIVLGMVGFAALGASNGAGTVLASATSGTDFVVLVAASLGAVVGAREFASGLIRTWLAAVPRRGTVVAAKAIALLLVLVPVAVLGVLASALTAAVMLPGSAGVALDALDGAAILALVGVVGYLAAAALIGLGLGLLLRSTAGAVSAVLGILLVLPIVASLALPESWSWVGDYLPSEAGHVLTQVAGAVEGRTPAAAAAVLLAWVVAAGAAAVATLHRRDA